MKSKGSRVEVRAEEVPLPPWAKKAEVYVQKTLEHMGHDNWDLSVLFCNNKFIKSLNAQYADTDEATDVLSFPQGEKTRGGRFLAGDIVISLDALEENTRFFDVTMDEELRRLLIHAILHLSGQDHKSNNAEEAMIKTQEEILSKVKDPIIIEPQGEGK